MLSMWEDVRRVLWVTWRDPRRRDAALWSVVTLLFVGFACVVFRAASVAGAGLQHAVQLPITPTPANPAMKARHQDEQVQPAGTFHPASAEEFADLTEAFAADGETVFPSVVTTVVRAAPQAPVNPPADAATYGESEFATSGKPRFRRIQIGTAPRMRVPSDNLLASQPSGPRPAWLIFDTARLGAPSDGATAGLFTGSAAQLKSIRHSFQLNVAAIGTPSANEGLSGPPALGSEAPDVGSAFSPAPEPGSLGLLLLSCGILVLPRRRRVR